MNSMASNQVYDLVELLDDEKSLDVNESLKQKRTY